MTTTYRVYVSTDLGGDPDDIQSLYRLLHYSDILHIEGIGSCNGPGAENQAELIRHWIQRIDLEHLRERGHPELMQEDDLLARVHQGAKVPGEPARSRRTAASEHLVACAMSGAWSADRPLWVLVWGSMTDVAQALFDEPAIAPRVRIYSIGSSNTEHDPAARDWIYRFMDQQHRELWWIENGIMPKWSRDTFRGCYQHGEQTGKYDNKQWIQEVIRGRGSTHDGQFAERCGDAFPVADSPNGTLKEGDTPTFLYLLAPVIAGVGDVDDPTQPSWGGQFHRPEPNRFANYYTDLDADAHTCQMTIARWRVQHLDAWEQRWAWYD